MVESEMKVYELAKELGVDSISLLDKLNGLNIKVKNHMSDLRPEEVQIVRGALTKKAPAATKAKTTKSKSTATKTATKTPAKTAASAGTTTRTRKKTATPEAPAAPAATETQDAAKAAAAPVIRRRVKSDGATETLVAPAGQASSEAEDITPPLEASATEAQDYSSEALEATQGESAEMESTESAIAEDISGEDSQAPASEQAAASESAMAGTPSRQPYTPAPRPVAPRKSFLKIVEATAPPPRPIIKPAAPTPTKTSVRGAPSSTDKEGYRIIKMNKESLDKMVEEEAAKKRGAREVGIRPEDVRFADYRKKEMVFLPKKKKLPLNKELKKTEITTPKATKRVVEMGEAITVQDLANQLNVKAGDVIRKLMGMGQKTSINQSVDFDTATLVASEYEYEVKNVSFKEEEFLDTDEDQEEQLKPRPPVVTIMGHVDHGKTSLLDAIREAKVAAGEAGGITQHIGAYTVEKDGKLISFIDTPGHEAFTAMRTRGANVTDIVILVVAADDGVMPQTREALSHAQAAGVPIIVAVNKIDKPGANPEKIKQGLAELNLLSEDWGGQTMFVPVSALQKTNLDKLLEAILLQAEVLDLKANPDAQASGTVLEARLEKGRGPVASVLVKRGTLRVGDPIVSGVHVGRVRALMDDKGKNVKEAPPGFAAEVLGFETLPEAGERFDSPMDDMAARKIAGNRQDQERAKKSASTGRASLDDLFAKIQSGAAKELSVILKADVFGSVEAIRDSLAKISTDQLKVKVILSAPGGITESDVLLASASQAVIIGFNVRPDNKARQLAEREHIEIKTYSIIYELIDDIKKSMVGLLDKKKVEKFLGRAEVRQTFSVPKIGTVAGSAVIDGKIVRGANVRLLRDSRIIYEGKMSSLRRFKDDAKEVASGYECGIGLENYNDLKPGDVIEAYQIELVTPDLPI